MRFTPSRPWPPWPSCAPSPARPAADAPQCELKRPVNFGAMNWESNLVLVDVERFIMEKGYGCKTETLPTETPARPGRAGARRPRHQHRDLAEQRGRSLGARRKDRQGQARGRALHGRRSLVYPALHGRAPARAEVGGRPAQVQDQFKDPEEPGKGRFYGCPAGWGCEVTSTNLFHALKLDDSYTLYSPGTGGAEGGPDVGLQAQAERGLLLLVAHAAGRRDGPGQARHAALRRGKAQVPDVARAPNPSPAPIPTIPSSPP